MLNYAGVPKVFLWFKQQKTNETSDKYKTCSTYIRF